LAFFPYFQERMARMTILQFIDTHPLWSLGALAIAGVTVVLVAIVVSAAIAAALSDRGEGGGDVA
jgi:hypothetical protein